MLSEIAKDVRKGARSSSMMQSDDQEEITKRLDSIMKEAVAAQATESSDMIKSSIQELTQTRKNLIARRYDVDDETRKKYVITSSALREQLKDSLKAVDENIVGTLKTSMPDTDSIISAVMTANPIVGYGAKMLKDVTSAFKVSKKRESEKILNSTKVNEEHVLKTENMTNVNETHFENIEGYLIEANDKLQSLINIWSDSSSEEKVIASESSQVTSETNEILKKSYEQDVVNYKEEKRRNKELMYEGQYDDSVNKNVLDEDSGGFDFSFMGGIGNILKPIFGFFSGLAPLAVAALKLSGVGTILYSIYSFFDGIINASEILGIDDSELTLSDRIIAGFSNLLGSLLKFVDWLVNKLTFGMVDFDTKDIEKNIARKLKDVKDSIFEMFTKVFDWVMSAFNNIKEDISNVIDVYKKDGIIAASKALVGFGDGDDEDVTDKTKKSDVTDKTKKSVVTDKTNNQYESVTKKQYSYLGYELINVPDGDTYNTSALDNYIQFNQQNESDNGSKVRDGTISNKSQSSVKDTSNFNTTNNNNQNVNVINNNNQSVNNSSGNGQGLNVQSLPTNNEPELRYINRDQLSLLTR